MSGPLSRLWKKVQAQAAKKRTTAATAGPAPTFPDPGQVPADVTQRLSDLYSQTFGSANDGGGGSVAVVPVQPDQQSGGGINVGKIALVAAVGVGGFIAYKHFKGAAT